MLYLDCSQALLAVPLLDTNVDVILGIRGVGVLISRVRKGICGDKGHAEGRCRGGDQGCTSKGLRTSAEGWATLPKPATPQGAMRSA